MGILIETIFDKENAKRTFEALKQTSFYSQEREIWLNSENKQNTYHSNSQLLGIVVEAMLDKKEAKRRYEALKQTPLYKKREKRSEF